MMSKSEIKSGADFRENMKARQEFKEKTKDWTREQVIDYLLGYLTTDKIKELNQNFKCQ